MNIKINANADPASCPITLEQARAMHLNYLQAAEPHVETEVAGVRKIVSSFILEQDDLNRLMQYAANGIRLYFCKTTQASEYLNIIAVPIKADDHNEVRKIVVGTYPPVINTLEPCPTMCPPHNSTEDLNCRRKNGVFYWCRPNEITPAGKIWFDAAGNACDEPMPPYDE